MQKLAEISGCHFDDWTKRIPSGCLVNRDEAILAACRGKSVLHVGACDAPFEVEKGKAGKLLHQKVRAVAERIVGVDIDGPAISALRELGVDDILQANIISDDTVLAGQTFDVVLCCDVIEHVGAAGPLLQACRRFMHSQSLLIVTTINATAIKPALRAVFGREAVHADHVAYYSYGTLGKLLQTEGLHAVEFGVFSYPTVNPVVGWLSRGLMNAAPGSADGIMFCARLA